MNGTIFCLPDHYHVQLPELVEESSLEDPTPCQPDADTVNSLQFEIVMDGTKRRRGMLVDSLGYRYNIKRRGKTTIDWQCTTRPKGNECRASVKQDGEDFQPGLSSHNHPADTGALLATKIRTNVKRKAEEQLFRPAQAIVQEVKDISISIWNADKILGN